uniref:non-specific serine/threonine protein kinase n=1 Tax=Marseillevirus LCMAC101 TaxID=2506602 RepID=A0A481YRD0_9VIRU|nr:MAG: putative serine/threonine protein kinase [Marseillevirus LCMAC101]
MPTPDFTGDSYNGYAPMTFIAAGSFGQVYKSSKNGRNFALKVFLREKDYKEELRAFQEVSNYGNCNKYLLCAYDNFVVEGFEVGVKRYWNNPYDHSAGYVDEKRGIGIIVIELMDESLGSFIDNQGLPSPQRLVSWMGQLLEGLAYIHEKGFAYRDLKVDNIMWSDTPRYTVKIGDMGFLCNNQPAYPIRCQVAGTYLSPEVVEVFQKALPNDPPEMKLEEAKKMDVWLMGLVFWMLTHGSNKFPFALVAIGGRFGNSVRMPRKNITPNEIAKSDYDRDFGRISRRTINHIIDWMFTVDPNERPTAREVLEYWKSDMNGCKLGNDFGSRNRANTIAALIARSDLPADFKIWTTDQLRTLADTKNREDILNFLGTHQILPQSHRTLPLSKLCSLANDWLASQVMKGERDMALANLVQVRGERSTMRRDRDTARTDLGQANRDRDTARADLGRIRRERDTARTNLTNVRGELAGERNKLRENKTTIANLRAELQTERNRPRGGDSDAINRLVRDLDAERDRLRQNKTTIRNLKRDLQTEKDRPRGDPGVTDRLLFAENAWKQAEIQRDSEIEARGRAEEAGAMMKADLERYQNLVDQRDEREMVEGCKLFNKILSDSDLSIISRMYNISPGGKDKDQLCTAINRYMMEDRQISRDIITNNIISICGTIRSLLHFSYRAEEEYKKITEESIQEAHRLYQELKMFGETIKNSGQPLDNHIKVASLLDVIGSYSASQRERSCIRTFLLSAGLDIPDKGVLEG